MLPAKSVRESKLTLGEFLVGWMRLRSDSTISTTLIYSRILKRTLHWFAQQAESSLMACSVTEMPAPQAGKQHPFQKFFRYTGAKSLLQAHLASRFMVRGGGFVSTKEEKELHRLGIVPKKSSISGKTVSQFCALHLLKATNVTKTALERSSMPAVNFCCDAARVFKMQAWPAKRFSSNTNQPDPQELRTQQ